MKFLEVTRGFWTGLGIALVITAIFWPITVGGKHARDMQLACIRQHGEWKTDSQTTGSYCHLYRQEDQE